MDYMDDMNDMGESTFEELARNHPKQLLLLMEEMSPTRLTFAAEALGHAPPELALPKLRELLQHPEDYVREGALYGLGFLGAKAEILTAIDDPNEEIRNIVAELLD